MKKTGIFLGLVATSLIIWRCTKPYVPAETTTDYGFLVVEGAINAGTDSTIIKLSRTVKLQSITTYRPELKATVTVESDQGNTFALTETSNGYYINPGLNLDNTKKYRLSIKTTNGKTYRSDFIAVKNAPPIDSIGYTINTDGISIYNNSHDATGNTRYYRYDFQETWKFNAAYHSHYIAVDLVPPLANLTRAMVRRTPDQEIYTCWTGAPSNSILVASSAKLTQDVIEKNIITGISSTSEKISVRYSILLKQYALTAEAYDYWVLTKKNTEQLGSIFDAQPSTARGNIHNIADTNEPVIGYMSVGVVQSKRVFIDKTELPSQWRVPTECRLDTAYFVSPITGLNDVATFLYSLPVTSLGVDTLFKGPPGMQRVVGFSFTFLPCGDCTLKGVTKQPSFWK